MNKVITINLNGNAYQMEEAGYERLQAYLEKAGRVLAGNPDRDEIIADIEQAVADKLLASLGSRRSVASTASVDAIIDQMGAVDGGPSEDVSGTSPRASASSGGAGDDEQPRRLYRITEDRMLGGVCNGLAVYLNLDVTIVRVIVMGLGFVSGGGVLLAYALLWAFVPEAKSDSDRAAMRGGPITAEQVLRRAKRGYYESASGNAGKPLRTLAWLGLLALGVIGLAAITIPLLMLLFQGLGSLFALPLRIPLGAAVVLLALVVLIFIIRSKQQGSSMPGLGGLFLAVVGLFALASVVMHWAARTFGGFGLSNGDLFMSFGAPGLLALALGLLFVMIVVQRRR